MKQTHSVVNVSLKGHCHKVFVKREKPKDMTVLISDNLQTMIPFRIIVLNISELKPFIVVVGQG